MSFQLRIPEEHLGIIKKILNLDEKQKKVIYDKFKLYKPSKLGEDIQRVEEFKDFPEIFEVIILLFRLYHNLLEDQTIKDIDDFISQLVNSFIEQNESEKYEDTDNEIQSMKQFFKELLTIDTPFFYFEKAIKLLFERSKLVESTRIITDIRPVFKEQDIESPDYSLITHNLRIFYIKDLNNKKKAFFALDHQDLIQLRSQIERALEKEEELQKLCQKAGLEIFEV